MLPEVEKYFDKQSNGKINGALKALRKSSNPLVRWIAEQPSLLTTYRDQVETVLRALPMNQGELATFGERRGWGYQFQTLVQSAASAGVLERGDVLVAGTSPQTSIPAVNVNGIDIEPLVNDLANAYGSNDPYVKERIRGIIGRYVPVNPQA